MSERIIVTMTTWSRRIHNIPAILDTIFAQSIPPDLVVLNLAFEENIPSDIQEYIENHSIEVNRVPDTKVYKKLIPTLKKYPDDCIIAIDDDWLYPKHMIEDFMCIHKRFPQYPISGNKMVLFQLQCHCGCASLVKASYFGNYLDYIDDEVIKNCSSDDIVYTYFANKAGNPYIRTNEEYYTNMKSFNDIDSYSKRCVKEDGINSSYTYLTNRFGQIPSCVFSYISDDYFASLISDIYKRSLVHEYQRGIKKTEDVYLSSYSFRLGHCLLTPFIWMKKHLVHNKRA